MAEESNFDKWLKELEEKETPTACNIENEECDSCGS
jgi:hypothetical protein